MQQKYMLNEVEKELAYLSASIASGCRPCTKYHLQKSRAIGISDDEIKIVIAAAISIRKNAASSIDSFAHAHSMAEKDEEINKEKPDRKQAIASIAAAYSVNCSSSFKNQLDRVRKSGITDQELSEIINLSKLIVDQARAHMDLIAGNTRRDKEAKYNVKNRCRSNCAC